MIREQTPARPLSFSDRARWLWNVSFPEGGWHFVDARFLALRVRVDAAAAKRMLPWGLEPAKPALATIFLARFPESRAVGQGYDEAGIFLHVTHRGKPGLHCPWIVVSDDIALILGRDFLGYPKKIADVDFQVDDTTARGRVVRKGKTVLEISATLGAVDPSPPPMEALPTYNVTSSVGTTPAWLVKFHPKEEILESRHARAELTVMSSDRDPIADLGFGAVESAHYYRIKLGGSQLPRPVLPVSPGYWIHNWSLRSR